MLSSLKGRKEGKGVERKRRKGGKERRKKEKERKEGKERQNTLLLGKGILQLFLVRVSKSN